MNPTHDGQSLDGPAPDRPAPLSRGRATAVVATVAALAVGLGIGVGVGVRLQPDAARAAVEQTPGPDDVRLVSAALRPAASCDALLDSFIARGLEQVGPWGWGYGPRLYALDDAVTLPPLASGSAESSDAGADTAASTARAESSGTGTNGQEAGVDEADHVKAADGLLVRVDGGELLVYDVTGAEPVQVGRLALASLGEDAELLLADGVATVVGADTRGAWLREHLGTPGTPRTRVVTVDLADPAAPVVTDERVIGAALESVRLHGDVVRVVTQGGLPDLAFTRPPTDGVEPLTEEDYEEALRANQDVVRASTLEDWLPTVTVGDGDPEPLADCDDVAVPADDDAALGVVAVTGFVAGSPAAGETGAVATGTSSVYVSADRLVLAQGETGACCWAGGPDWPIDWGQDTPVPPGELTDPSTLSMPAPELDGTTALHSFALEGTLTTYVASGEVEGTVRDRWSIDEADGVLRVAVGPSLATGNHNSVVTLRESGTDLVEVGRLDGLGVDEEIKAVRWFDDLAVVVTFRQIDPLYAVDLTDPAAPRALGELKIPGFSEYLHPLGTDRMIGIGQDATASGVVRGAQAALFDLSDLTAPRRLDTVAYPKHSQAGAALDPRQFTWLPEQRVALTVVSQGWTGRTGWVSVLRVGEGRLDPELVEVERGDDVARVRLVPLADGRVVLVTADGVRTFAL